MVVQHSLNHGLHGESIVTDGPRFVLITILRHRTFKFKASKGLDKNQRVSADAVAYPPSPHKISVALVETDQNNKSINQRRECEAFGQSAIEHQTPECDGKQQRRTRRIVKIPSAALVDLLRDDAVRHSEDFRRNGAVTFGDAHFLLHHSQ